MIVVVDANVAIEWFVSADGAFLAAARKAGFAGHLQLLAAGP